jgi:hypothetical protein
LLLLLVTSQRLFLPLLVLFTALPVAKAVAVVEAWVLLEAAPEDQDALGVMGVHFQIHPQPLLNPRVILSRTIHPVPEPQEEKPQEIVLERPAEMEEDYLQIIQELVVPGEEVAPTSPQGPPLINPRINVTEGGMQHVLERHILNGIPELRERVSLRRVLILRT